MRGPAFPTAIPVSPTGDRRHLPREQRPPDPEPAEPTRKERIAALTQIIDDWLQGNEDENTLALRILAYVYPES